MLPLQPLRQPLDAHIKRLNSLIHQRRRLRALRHHQRATIHGRHVEEDEVPRARVIQLLDEAIVDGEDLVIEDRGGGVAEPPAVPDVVDAHEDPEERVGARPGGREGVGGDEELLDLVGEGEHLWGVGGYERGGDGGAAVGEVVGEQLRGVVFDGEEIDPVRSVGGGPAGVAGVSQWVSWCGLCEGHIEAGLGVGIAAGDCQLGWERKIDQETHKMKAFLIFAQPG